ASSRSRTGGGGGGSRQGRSRLLQGVHAPAAGCADCRRRRRCIDSTRGWQAVDYLTMTTLRQRGGVLTPAAAAVEVGGGKRNPRTQRHHRRRRRHRSSCFAATSTATAAAAAAAVVTIPGRDHRQKHTREQQGLPSLKEQVTPCRRPCRRRC
ncbi:unnamed protein product, partial [Ectocarpus sp. 6 AP-2014]